MGAPHKYEKVLEVLEYTKNGKSPQEIVVLTHIGYDTIRRWIKNPPKPPLTPEEKRQRRNEKTKRYRANHPELYKSRNGGKKYPPEVKEKILALLKEGKSIKEIILTVGVPASVVHYYKNPQVYRRSDRRKIEKNPEKYKKYHNEYSKKHYQEGKSRYAQNQRVRRQLQKEQKEAYLAKLKESLLAMEKSYPQPEIIEQKIDGIL